MNKMKYTDIRKHGIKSYKQGLIQSNYNTFLDPRYSEFLAMIQNYVDSQRAIIGS